MVHLLGRYTQLVGCLSMDAYALSLCYRSLRGLRSFKLSLKIISSTSVKCILYADVNFPSEYGLLSFFTNIAVRRDKAACLLPWKLQSNVSKREIRWEILLSYKARTFKIFHSNIMNTVSGLFTLLVIRYYFRTLCILRKYVFFTIMCVVYIFSQSFPVGWPLRVFDHFS